MKFKKILSIICIVMIIITQISVSSLSVEAVLPNDADEQTEIIKINETDLETKLKIKEKEYDATKVAVIDFTEL